MGIAGYKIFDKKGKLVDEITGHAKKEVLNKYRKVGLKVRKMVMPKFKERNYRVLQ